MVVATPALRALRRAAPSSRITLIVSPLLETFAKRIPSVDEVLAVPLTPELTDSCRYAASLQEFAVEMRARCFDLAIQLTGGGESTNPFVAALGARITVGSASPAASDLDFTLPYAQAHQAEVLRLADVVTLAGAPCQDLRTEVALFPQDIAELEDVPGVDRLALAHRRYLAVHVGSHSRPRRWRPERFAGVLDALLDETDLQGVLLGKDEMEQELCRQVLGGMRHRGRVLNLSGQLRLGPLLALLSRARLFIGNDSGPAHLAEALAVPSVIIFGNGHPARWAPLCRLWQRPLADIYAPCRCHLPCGCDGENFRCLDGVTVEQVVDEARSLLSLLRRCGDPRDAGVQQECSR